MSARGPALAFILLALLPFLVYAVNLDDYFVGDDFDLIHSFHGKPASYFVGLLFNTESGDVWTHYGLDAAAGRGFIRPIPVWLLKLDSMIWGVTPLGYHLTSYLCFSVLLLLVFALARSVAGTCPAFLAALAVGLHPMYARVVPWIAGREEVTAAMLCVGALFFLVRHRRDGGRLAGYYLLLALALLTKEWTLGVLGLAVVFDLICRRPFCGWRNLLRTHAPAVAVALGYLALRYAAFGNIKGGYGTGTAYFSPAAFVEFHLSLLGELLGPTMLSAGRLPSGSLLAGLLASVPLLWLAAAWKRISAEDRRLLLFFGPVWYLGSTAILYGIDFDPRRCALPVVGLALFGAILLDVLLRASRRDWTATGIAAVASALVVAFLPVSVGHGLKFQTAGREVARIVADIDRHTASLPPGSAVYVARAPQDELPPYYFGWSFQAALKRPFLASDLASHSTVINPQNIWMNHLRPQAPQHYDVVLDYPVSRVRLDGRVLPPPPLPTAGG